MVGLLHDLSSQQSDIALHNKNFEWVMYCIHTIDYKPCPMPIPPTSLDRAVVSNTSRTMPFALHWQNRPFGPQVTMPQASCPRCCRRDNPSQISGAESILGSCKRRPNIPHTNQKMDELVNATATNFFENLLFVFNDYSKGYGASRILIHERGQPE